MRRRRATQASAPTAIASATSAATKPPFASGPDSDVAVAVPGNDGLVAPAGDCERGPGAALRGAIGSATPRTPDSASAPRAEALPCSSARRVRLDASTEPWTDEP